MIEQATHPCEQSSWESFARCNGALLVVGHGTRKPAGVAQLVHLVEQMQSLIRGVPIEASFLELAEPTIENAISKLAQRGVRQIVVVPVLLFAAKHAREDIPKAVSTAAQERGVDVIGLTPALGTHPLAIELSSNRYREILDLENGKACLRPDCAITGCEPGVCKALGVPLGRVGLAMVGRGTSDSEVIQQMRSFTALRCERDKIKQFETGFFAGGQLHVEKLLDIASSWNCDTIIVQPHLLFEGELMDQLRSMVSERIRQSPHPQWRITRTLGADLQLARLWSQMALEFVRV